MHDTLSDKPDPLRTTDVETQAEDSAKRCPACDACHALRENVGPGSPSWEHIRVLQNIEELRSFPNLQTTPEKHIADQDGILAYYRFSTKVPCSLKGRHPHQTGLVVQTLCNLVICMGRDCGRKSIIGFQDIWQSADRRIQFQTDCEYLAGWAKRYRARIDLLERPLRARDELAETIRIQLPEMWSDLIDRRRRGAAGLEVIIPAHGPLASPSRLAGKENVHVRRLAGLDIFTKSRRPKFEELRRALGRFEKEERERPPIDGDSALALRRAAKSADTKAAAAEHWIRETSAFLSEENLRLILFVLKKDNPILNAEARGWRVGYMPGRSALLSLPDVPVAATDVLGKMPGAGA